MDPGSSWGVMRWSGGWMLGWVVWDGGMRRWGGFSSSVGIYGEIMDVVAVRVLVIVWE